MFLLTWLSLVLLSLHYKAWTAAISSCPSVPGLSQTLPCTSAFCTIGRLATSSVMAALTCVYECLVKSCLQLANGQIVEVPPTLIKRQKQHFTILEGTGKSVIVCIASVTVEHGLPHQQGLLILKFVHFQWQQAECNFASQQHRRRLPCPQKDSLCVPTVHGFSQAKFAAPGSAQQRLCKQFCPQSVLHAHLNLTGSFSFFFCRCSADLGLEWCHLGLDRNHAISRSIKTQHGLRCSATSCEKCVTN